MTVHDENVDDAPVAHYLAFVQGLSKFAEDCASFAKGAEGGTPS